LFYYSSFFWLHTGFKIVRFFLLWKNMTKKVKKEFLLVSFL